jgi:hypothetical protein
MADNDRKSYPANHMLAMDGLWRKLERRLRLHVGPHRTCDGDGPNGNALIIFKGETTILITDFSFLTCSIRTILKLGLRFYINRSGLVQHSNGIV